MNSLLILGRFKEAKSLMRKIEPLTRRILGEDDRITLIMRWNYANARFRDDSATLDDLAEAVATLEDVAPTARRVLGGAHPTTEGIEACLQYARDVLHAREGTA